MAEPLRIGRLDRRARAADQERRDTGLPRFG